MQEVRNQNENWEERLAREERMTAKFEADLAAEHAELQSMRSAEKQEAETLCKLQVQRENLEREAFEFAEALDQARASLQTECFNNAATQEDTLRAP